MIDREYYIDEWGDDVVEAFERRGIPYSQIPERCLGVYAGDTEEEVVGSYIYTQAEAQGVLEREFACYVDWTRLGQDAIDNGSYIASSNFVFWLD